MGHINSLLRGRWERIFLFYRCVFGEEEDYNMTVALGDFD